MFHVKHGKNHKRKKQKLKTVLQDLGKDSWEVNFIFCDDEYLLNVNKQYLKHDTYTDVISFDYSDEGQIMGDIFISLDRIKENAKKFSQSVHQETYRVMIHGILHLCGCKDKTKKESETMRTMEDYYLNQCTIL